MNIRIGIFGAGKLANAILEEARAVNAKTASASGSPQFLIEWVVDKGDPIPAHAIDVAIDASMPDAVESHLVWAIETSTAFVIATTGWDIPDMETRIGNKTAVLVSPNFSFTVTFMRRIATQLAQFADWYGEGDLAVFEHHHSAKKDAPSGTAKALAQAIVSGSKRYTAWNASGWDAWDPGKVAIASLRAGSEAGVHEIVFDAPHEQLSIIHRARDRRVFASGALKAAQWILGRKGLFGMDDVLESMLGSQDAVSQEV
ncbi:MAG: dihydrodipicolinate reductase C-terminal domain-containing protein [Rectinema sp.]